MKLKRREQNHTPEGWSETENEDWGAHFNCERATPLILKRVSTGSDPTATIYIVTGKGEINMNKN